MATVPLTTEHYRRLVRLLAENSSLVTPVRREAMLDEAGLHLVRTRLDFATDARTFAAQLVRVLQDHGTLADTGLPALVSLLRWLRKERGGDAEDAAFLDGLLAPYGSADDSATAAAPPSATVSSGVVRDLLLAAFSDGDLTAFCYDHFRAVYEEFTSGMARSDKVQRLVEHCERKGETVRLLELVKQANPYQYSRIIGASGER